MYFLLNLCFLLRTNMNWSAKRSADSYTLAQKVTKNDKNEQKAFRFLEGFLFVFVDNNAYSSKNMAYFWISWEAMTKLC